MSDAAAQDDLAVGIQPEESKRRGGILWLFALLPLLCALMLCASQAALRLAEPMPLEIEIAALETADYSQWPDDRFAPVDERIGTDVARDNQTTGEIIVNLNPTLAQQIAAATAQAGGGGGGGGDGSSVASVPTDPVTGPQTATAAALTATSVAQTATISALTATATPNTSASPSPSPTPSATGSLTATATGSASSTATSTATPTGSLTATRTPTATGTLTQTATSTGTRTTTPTRTPLQTPTPLPTATLAPTLTATTAPVIPPPNASFSVSGSGGNAPVTVSLTNLSSGNITGYFWTFGDGVGTSSSPTPPPYTYTIPGTYTISLTVTGPGGIDTFSAAVVVNPAPTPSSDLVMTISAGNTTPGESQSIGGLTVTLTNLGTSPASSVRVQMTLPSGLTYSGMIGGGTYTAGTGQWTIGNLASGASLSMTLTLTTNPGTGGTTQTISAVASAAQLDPNTGNNAASINILVQVPAAPTADLSLSGGASPAVLDGGLESDITFTVTNLGTNTATAVTVQIVLPTGTTFVSSAQCSGASVNYTCNLGSVISGGSANAVLRLRTTAAGTRTVSASVASALADPNTANNNASATLTINPAADLRMNKTSSATRILIGGTFDYRLQVINNGVSTATGVVVTDTLPAEVSFISSPHCTVSGANITCNLANIASGGNFTAVVTVSADVLGKNIPNSATVTGTLPDIAPGNNSDTTLVDIELQSADMAIAINLPAAPVTAMDIFDVFFQLTNNGPDQATSITINGVLPAEVTVITAPAWCTVTGVNFSCAAPGALNSGQNTAATFTVQATTPSAVATFSANVGSAVLDPSNTNNSASAALGIDLPAADLQMVILEFTPLSGNQGAATTLEIEVRNLSGIPVTNVVVSAIRPAGMTYVTSITTQGLYNDGMNEWAVGTLNAGAVAEMYITFTTDVGTAGTTINAAPTVSSSSISEINLANNSLSASYTVNPFADVRLVSAVGMPNPILVGETSVITALMGNSGPNGTSGAFMSITLPAYLAFQSNDCVSPVIVGQTLTCSMAGVYNSGDSTTVNVTVLASGAGASPITITVGATEADPVPGNNSLTTQIDATVPTVDIQVSKTSSETNPTEGAVVAYTITAANISAVNATSVTITDFLPAGITYVGSSATSGSYDPILGTWTVGALNAGASATLTINVTVNGGTAGTTITNTATRTNSTPADGSAANDSASVVMQPVAPDGLNVGAPDGAFIALACVSSEATRVVNLGAAPIVTHAGYDLAIYEYESPPNPGFVRVERVIYEVGTSAAGPWIVVFNWGDSVLDANTSLGAAGYGGSSGPGAGEPNIDLPMSDPPMFGSVPFITGIAIDVDAVAPAGTYPYVRLRALTCGGGNEPEVDAVQVLP